MGFQKPCEESFLPRAHAGCEMNRNKWKQPTARDMSDSLTSDVGDTSLILCTSEHRSFQTTHCTKPVLNTRSISTHQLNSFTKLPAVIWCVTNRDVCERKHSDTELKILWNKTTTYDNTAFHQKTSEEVYGLQTHSGLNSLHSCSRFAAFVQWKLNLYFV